MVILTGILGACNLGCGLLLLKLYKTVSLHKRGLAVWATIELATGASCVLLLLHGSVLNAIGVVIYLVIDLINFMVSILMRD